MHGAQSPMPPSFRPASQPVHSPRGLLVQQPVRAVHSVAKISSTSAFTATTQQVASSASTVVFTAANARQGSRPVLRQVAQSPPGPIAQSVPIVQPAAEPSLDEALELSFSQQKRALLSATIQHICRSIRTDPLQSTAANVQLVRAFSEQQYYSDKDPERMDPYFGTLLDVSPVAVSRFILDILERGFFDIAEFIISIHYIERFKERSGVPMHVTLWRPLFVTALLLADKMWEDKSVKNSSLTLLFPVLSNAQLFELEVLFLEQLRFSAWLPVQDFQGLSRSLLQRSARSAEIESQIEETSFCRTLVKDAQEAAETAAKKQQKLLHNVPQYGPPTPPQAGSPWPSTAPATRTHVSAEPPTAAVPSSASTATGMKRGKSATGTNVGKIPVEPPWGLRKTVHGGPAAQSTGSVGIKAAPTGQGPAPAAPVYASNGHTQQVSPRMPDPAPQVQQSAAMVSAALRTPEKAPAPSASSTALSTDRSASEPAPWGRSSQAAARPPLPTQQGQVRISQPQGAPAQGQWQNPCAPPAWNQSRPQVRSSSAAGPSQASRPLTPTTPTGVPPSVVTPGSSLSYRAGYPVTVPDAMSARSVYSTSSQPAAARPGPPFGHALVPGIPMAAFQTAQPTMLQAHAAGGVVVARGRSSSPASITAGYSTSAAVRRPMVAAQMSGRRVG